MHAALLHTCLGHGRPSIVVFLGMCMVGPRQKENLDTRKTAKSFVCLILQAFSQHIFYGFISLHLGILGYKYIIVVR